jgi:DNA-binding MarR family transcriptional regulator
MELREHVGRITVTALLNRMERDGFVIRRANPSNKREIFTSLTASGVERAKEAYPLLIAADRALNHMLQGDFEGLKRKIEQLNEVLAEE